MCARRKRDTRVGGGSRHTHDRTVHVSTAKMSAFTLSSSAALGSVKVRRSPAFTARSRTRTAATVKRRRLRCRVFVAPASRRTARAEETTGSRANAVGARCPREGDCPVARPPSPSRVSRVDLGHAHPIGDADSTQTLLSGFDGTHARAALFRRRALRCAKEKNESNESNETNDADLRWTSHPLVPHAHSRTGRRAQDLRDARPPLRRGECGAQREGPEAHWDSRARDCG